MEAPKYFSTYSKRIWKRIEKQIGKEQLIILDTALRAYDQMIKARKEVDKNGLIVKADNGFSQKNPAILIEKDARNGFLTAWKMLGLDSEPTQKIGRPPTKRKLEWEKVLAGGNGK